MGETAGRCLDAATCSPAQTAPLLGRAEEPSRSLDLDRSAFPGRSELLGGSGEPRQRALQPPEDALLARRSRRPIAAAALLPSSRRGSLSAPSSTAETVFAANQLSPDSFWTFSSCCRSSSLDLATSTGADRPRARSWPRQNHPVSGLLSHAHRDACATVAAGRGPGRCLAASARHSASHEKRTCRPLMQKVVSRRGDLLSSPACCLRPSSLSLPCSRSLFTFPLRYFGLHQRQNEAAHFDQLYSGRSSCAAAAATLLPFKARTRAKHSLS